MSPKKCEHGTAPYSVPQFTEVLKAVAGALPRGLEGTDPKEVIRAVQKEGEALGILLQGVFAELLQKLCRLIKLISAGESLIIDPVNGTEVIAKAKRVFPAGIDGDFERWGADELGQPTPETPVEVYEMVKDAAFAQMFDSLNTDRNKLCLSQHQIINFVEKYRSWLRADGYGTFFLFKSHGEFFVASVLVDSDGLLVFVRRFGHSRVWYADYRPRVVVPPLAA